MPTDRQFRVGLGDRVFKAAMRTLPQDFRAAYGGEIHAFHRMRMQEAQGERMRGLALWCADLLDVLKGGMMERCRSGLERVRRGRGESVEFGGNVGPGRGSGWENPGIGLRVDTLLQDLRFALRSLGRTPGFTGVAVFSLAVGIGLLAGFYSLFQRTWLEPIPGVGNTAGVVELNALSRGSQTESFTYPDFRDLRGADTPFQDLAGWIGRDGTLSTRRGSEYVRMMSVSANYFRLLGVVPELGRSFLPAEDRGAGQHPVAVVSHEMWRTRLGGDPSVVGQAIILNQVPHTVVGVAPRGFTGHRTLVQETEVWTPLMQDPWVAGEPSWTEDRGSSWLRVLGRLREGATLEEGNAALTTLFTRFEEAHPDTNRQRRARAYRFGPVPAVGRSQSLLATLLLGGLLGVVLLIISGNVAGMVLARSVAREREIAVRLALGSGRRRLARLLLLEALILSLVGGVTGVFLGVWGMAAAHGLLPGAPQLEFPLGWHLLPPAVGLILATTALVGSFPAFRFSRPELVSSLKVGTGGGCPRPGRIHRFAATAQTGLALALLVISGLFVRAVDVLYETDLGFEPMGLITSTLDLPGVGIRAQDEAAVLLDRMKGALETLPGVSRVALADGHPADLVGNFTSVARLDRPEDEGFRSLVEFTRVGEGYFETVGTALLRGRGILRSDDASSEPVMVVTESLARRLWPGEDGLGQRVASGASREGPTEFTVVGVVEDVASSRPTERWPNVFFSLRQNHHPRVMVIVRASGDPRDLFLPVREALMSVEPDLPYPVVVHARSLVDQAGNSQRVSARVAGGLGGLAILLAAIGIYGVVAFGVSRRVREIGLRMAVGASRATVLRSVFRDALALATPGLLVGALLAGGAAAAFRSRLYGLSPVDPVSFVGAVCLLLVVVLLASFAPARMASSVDPMEALRRE